MEGNHATPPLTWGDRYDLGGLVLGAATLAVLLLLGAPVWAAIALGAAIVSIAAYLLRRRAGVPQMVLWQRLARRRRAPHNR